MTKDRARLKTILSNHVVPQDPGTGEIKNGNVKTLQGGQVALYRSGTFVTVDEAIVPGPDLRATNGSIKVGDKVLPPR